MSGHLELRYFIKCNGLTSKTLHLKDSVLSYISTKNLCAFSFKTRIKSQQGKSKRENWKLTCSLVISLNDCFHGLHLVPAWSTALLENVCCDN